MIDNVILFCLICLLGIGGGYVGSAALLVAAVGHCDVVEHPTVVDAVVEFVDLVVLDAVGSRLKGTDSRLATDGFSGIVIVATCCYA